MRTPAEQAAYDSGRKARRQGATIRQALGYASLGYAYLDRAWLMGFWYQDRIVKYWGGKATTDEAQGFSPVLKEDAP